MASRKNYRVGIQVVLGIIIVVLAYVLYESITEPYERVERRRALTEATRTRMIDIRQALIAYESEFDTFPSTLDSLTIYLRENPSIIDSLYGPNFELDSLEYSPRTGEPFEYAVNDTGTVDIYLLEDPNTEDQIGGLEPDPTQINVANWQ